MCITKGTQGHLRAQLLVWGASSSKNKCRALCNELRLFAVGFFSTNGSSPGTAGQLSFLPRVDRANTNRLAVSCHPSSTSTVSLPWCKSRFICLLICLLVRMGPYASWNDHGRLTRELFVSVFHCFNVILFLALLTFFVSLANGIVPSASLVPLPIRPWSYRIGVSHCAVLFSTVRRTTSSFSPVFCSFQQVQSS